MKRKPKVGDVVAVYFLDHMHNNESDNVRTFIVYGRVAVVKPESITIDSWAQMDPSAKRVVIEDVETFTLVWAAVTKVVQLEEVDE